MRSFNRKKKQGFTLIELLIAMAILGILAMVALSNFRTSQMKARDTQRKADLKQIATALEAYMNDNGVYPDAQTGLTYAGGGIIACGCGAVPALCNFGTLGGVTPGEMCDANATVYMKEIPGDPIGPINYCYQSGGTWFRLYANLEIDVDPDRLNWNRNCGSNGNAYDYGLVGGNTSL